MWCIPTLNDEYIERMEGILDLYEKPYDPEEPMICLDEKSVQLLKDILDPIAAKPGRIKKVDAEYKRCSTANIFVGVEPKKGKHFTYVTRNRKSKEFAKVLSRIEKKYVNAKTIHLVLDNLNTHRLKSLTDFYGKEEGERIWNRFTVHYTPKHGSWLNQAEIEISILSKQCLGKRRIDNIDSLRRSVNHWNKNINKKKTKIKWIFTSKKAKEKFKY